MLRRMARAYLKGLERGRRAQPKARFDLLLIYLETTGSEKNGTEFEVAKEQSHGSDVYAGQ